MAKPADIGSLIVLTPDVRGGRPRISGTGVTVRRIVEWYKLGLSPEEIAHEIGHITLAQVFAALAYYHANREEIETDLINEKVVADQLEVAQRGAGHKGL
jgi:uncharacterized protein (DUF433 family)